MAGKNLSRLFFHEDAQTLCSTTIPLWHRIVSVATPPRMHVLFELPACGSDQDSPGLWDGGLTWNGKDSRVVGQTLRDEDPDRCVVKHKFLLCRGSVRTIDPEFIPTLEVALRNIEPTILDHVRQAAQE